MIRRIVWGFLVSGVAFAACAAPAPEHGAERVGETAAAINSCRAACLVFASLTCRQVEEQCGKYSGQIVIDGDPFPCSEARPIACHLGATDALQACLDDCGNDDSPATGFQNPHPDPSFGAPIDPYSSGGSGYTGGGDGSGDGSYSGDDGSGSD